MCSSASGTAPRAAVLQAEREAGLTGRKGRAGRMDRQGQQAQHAGQGQGRASRQEGRQAEVLVGLVLGCHGAVHRSTEVSPAGNYFVLHNPSSSGLIHLALFF